MNLTLQGGSRCDRKRALVDGLVSRIQLRNDEMAGGAEGQHPSIVGIVIGAEPGEPRQETVV